MENYQNSPKSCILPKTTQMAHKVCDIDNLKQNMENCNLIPIFYEYYKTAPKIGEIINPSQNHVKQTKHCLNHATLAKQN